MRNIEKKEIYFDWSCFFFIKYEMNKDSNLCLYQFQLELSDYILIFYVILRHQIPISSKYLLSRFLWHSSFIGCKEESALQEINTNYSFHKSTKK